MTQLAKIVDLSETYVPVDPQAFPENMSFTAKEDYPSRSAPIVPYEGYNFMPTSYGYRSFFGQNATLNIDALESRCDDLFVLQTNTFENILIALCEDGIWTKAGESAGAWTQEIVLDIPEEGTHKNWSTAVINNTLHVYRAGAPTYWKFSPDAILSTELLAAPALVVTLSQGAVGTPGPVAGTYGYSIAYKDANGRLSAPCATVQTTTASALEITISAPRIATATNGYRIYRTAGAVVSYKDIPQTVAPNIIFASDDNVGWTVVTLPDTTVSFITYQPYKASPVTPTFLNMEGQIGIFKAGGKLGFWDSENSIGWSSIDDYSEFTPSLLTLAGSAVFEDVQGRIITILPHGDGFIIYATKSIVYVGSSPEATFQWSPRPILSNAGIAFPQEAVAAIPDTKHFVYTTVGLHKIEGAKAEVIVPEVTDFLKEANDPVFLRIMEGRYLALQILDPTYINGLVQFAVSTIPATTYTFPGTVPSLEDLIPGVTLTGIDVCSTVSALTSGGTSEMQAAGAAAVVAAGSPAKKAGTYFTPVYTAYLSNAGGLDPSNITWGATPCATVDPNGVEALMSPVGAAGKTSLLGTGAANKTAVSGADAYIDGRWTIERFVQVQTAIWKNEEANREAYVEAIVNRAYTGSKTTVDVASQDINLRLNPESTASTLEALLDTAVLGLGYPGPTSSECEIGTYITGSAGNYHFGFSGCSFWLTRYITEAKKIVRVKENTVAAVYKDLETYWEDKVNTGGVGEAGDPQSVCELRSDILGYPSGYFTAHPIAANAYTCRKWNDYQQIWQEMSSPDKHIRMKADKLETMNAYNKAVPIDVGIIPDTGYCVITGWRYTDVNNVERTVASSACAAPNPPATEPNTNAPSVNGLPASDPMGSDGTFCSIPFETITVPAIQADPLTWPDQTVTIPGGSFLLQEGSIGPIYPTFAGALVYDLHLKKWGKLKLNYKQLLDYSPINSSSGAIISSDVFGVRAGALSDSGTISLFDTQPEDSYIKYGKIGYYRLGFTNVEEIKLGFRSASTGFLSVETSLDGRSPEASLGTIEPFTAALEATAPSSSSGRWHSIKISGNYDLTHLEFRGHVAGRR